ELAGESLSRVHPAQDRVERHERRVQAVAQARALLALAGQGAEEALSLLRALEDVLQGPGDAGEIRDEVAAPLQQLLDPGAGSRRDLAADLDLGLLGRAALELDVLVAEEADRLDRRLRPLSQPRGGPAVHVVDDPHRAVGRVRG